MLACIVKHVLEHNMMLSAFEVKKQRVNLKIQSFFECKSNSYSKLNGQKMPGPKALSRINISCAIDTRIDSDHVVSVAASSVQRGRRFDCPNARTQTWHSASNQLRWLAASCSVRPAARLHLRCTDALTMSLLFFPLR